MASNIAYMELAHTKSTNWGEAHFSAACTVRPVLSSQPRVFQPLEGTFTEVTFFLTARGRGPWLSCLQATAPPAGAVSSEASFVLKMKIDDNDVIYIQYDSSTLYGFPPLHNASTKNCAPRIRNCPARTARLRAE